MGAEAISWTSKHSLCSAHLSGCRVILEPDGSRSWPPPETGSGDRSPWKYRQTLSRPPPRPGPPRSGPPDHKHGRVWPSSMVPSLAVDPFARGRRGVSSLSSPAASPLRPTSPRCAFNPTSTNYLLETGDPPPDLSRQRGAFFLASWIGSDTWPFSLPGRRRGVGSTSSAGASVFHRLRAPRRRFNASAVLAVSSFVQKLGGS